MGRRQSGGRPRWRRWRSGTPLRGRPAAKHRKRPGCPPPGGSRKWWRRRLPSTVGNSTGVPRRIRAITAQPVQNGTVGLHALAVTAPLHVDAYAAKYVEAADADSATVFVATGDLEGLTVQRAGARVRISLELDDTANHPFRAETRCVHNWRHPAPLADHSARQRAAG